MSICINLRAKLFWRCCVIKEWCATIDEKIKALEKHGTQELVELPNDKENVSLKWVYKIKCRPNGSIQAQLVGRDYMQCTSFDFNETFALVAR